jgi:hypothetical protein
MSAGFEADQLLATAHARHELGEDYDRAFVERFIEQVDREIAAQVDERVAEYARAGRFARRSWWPGGLAVVVSLTFAIPLTAIAGWAAHLPGIVACWAGIVGVNVAAAWRTRPRRVRRR